MNTSKLLSYALISCSLAACIVEAAPAEPGRAEAAAAGGDAAGGADATDTTGGSATGGQDNTGQGGADGEPSTGGAPPVEDECKPVTAGAAELGADCAEHSDCASARCVDVADDGRGFYCSAACDEPSDCPSTMFCKEMRYGDSYCWYGGNDVFADTSSDCECNEECSIEICYDGQCSTPCTASSDCPVGDACTSDGYCWREK